MAEYQKAIEQAPSMPRLHFDLGFLLWEQTQYPEAGAEFAKELRLIPGSYQRSTIRATLRSTQRNPRMRSLCLGKHPNATRPAWSRGSVKARHCCA